MDEMETIKQGVTRRAADRNNKTLCNLNRCSQWIWKENLRQLRKRVFFFIYKF